MGKRMGRVLMMVVLGCGKEESEKPAPRPENLWTYLEGFRKRPEMPDKEEIRRRFGEPKDVMEWSENVAIRSKNNLEEYRRYTDEDRRSKELDVLAWRYPYRGDDNRWVYLVLRKKEGIVVGWDWFENVPQGQQTGLPNEKP